MLQSIQAILHIIRHQFRMEWKSPQLLSANLLYVVSTIFIISKIFAEISDAAWNGIYWIVFLFMAVNATLHSFSREQNRSAIFYYSFAPPIELFVSKVIFNFLFITFSGLLLFILFAYFLRHPIVDMLMFLQVVIAVALGLSIQFSFTSAIAVYTQHNSTLMSILSIPLIIPVLLIAMKISLVSSDAILAEGISNDFLILWAINLIMLGIGLILFPFLWRR